MGANESNCTMVAMSDKFGGDNNCHADGNSMGKEDRKMRVLGVLVESACVMPTVVIFRNAKLRGADFERRSVDNYLRDLYEDGYIRKLDPVALDSGDMVDIEFNQEGYFVATGAGERAYHSY